ncbi:putative Thioredoxin reductase [Actinacidiphila bryophytorum]|uniref:Thioredoxin reductase n=1 Tax=Actinacidiphila bryophytorum TaxID=1436133 RepID=A0A9W4H3M5_9ACTN|nr:putative Thioredoxin reductase [Actinacidiphila bryophytorum]
MCRRGAAGAVPSTAVRRFRSGRRTTGPGSEASARSAGYASGLTQVAVAVAQVDMPTLHERGSPGRGRLEDPVCTGHDQKDNTFITHEQAAGAPTLPTVFGQAPGGALRCSDIFRRVHGAMSPAAGTIQRYADSAADTPAGTPRAARPARCGSGGRCDPVARGRAQAGRERVRLQRPARHRRPAGGDLHPADPADRRDARGPGDPRLDVRVRRHGRCGRADRRARPGCQRQGHRGRLDVRGRRPRGLEGTQGPGHGPGQRRQQAVLDRRVRRQVRGRRRGRRRQARLPGDRAAGTRLQPQQVLPLLQDRPLRRRHQLQQGGLPDLVQPQRLVQGRVLQRLRHLRRRDGLRRLRRLPRGRAGRALLQHGEQRLLPQYAHRQHLPGVLLPAQGLLLLQPRQRHDRERAQGGQLRLHRHRRQAAPDRRAGRDAQLPRLAQAGGDRAGGAAGGGLLDRRHLRQRRLHRHRHPGRCRDRVPALQVQRRARHRRAPARQVHADRRRLQRQHHPAGVHGKSELRRLVAAFVGPGAGTHHQRRLPRAVSELLLQDPRGLPGRRGLSRAGDGAGAPPPDTVSPGAAG